MRFIHLADVHLGAQPDLGYPWSKKREEQIWESFRRVIAEAAEEKTDLLIIAGDLFHRQPLMWELKEVNYLFSTIPDTSVVLIAGNHDYLKKDSSYLRFVWNDNVTGLWGESCSSVYLPKISTWVYGCSYHQREIRENLYRDVRPNGKDGFHILIGHGGDASHSPLDIGKLQAAGFDYAALGHIHKPQILAENRIAFSGALEPIDRNDTGPHGFIRGSCDRKGTRISFVPFASCSYVPLDIPMTEEDTQYSVEQTVRSEIESRGAQNIYKVALCGVRSPEIRFAAERFAKLGQVIETENRTRPGYNIKELQARYEGSLIGEYIRLYGSSEDEVERLAFDYGLEALLEAEGAL